MTRPVDVVAVRRMFDYDPATGILTWKEPTSRRVSVGRVAGTPQSAGYIHVGVNGSTRLAHHVIWAWWYGRSPVGDIDHINRDRSDNRITNLREVDRSTNLLNGEYQNSTGYPGVTQVPSGRYVAGIHVRRVRHYIGTFDTPEEAHEAYAERHIQLYGLKSKFHPEHVRNKA